MTALTGAQSREKHETLEMANIPAVDMAEGDIPAHGSLRGILTGVIAGTIIWGGTIALFVL